VGEIKDAAEIFRDGLLLSHPMSISKTWEII
jgi:hypothetical protein